MHYETHYDQYTNPAEKRRAALNDIKNWIGIRKFNEVSKMAKECVPPITFDQFEFACAISGIEGYPVKAWAEEIGIPVPTQTKEGMHDDNS